MTFRMGCKCGTVDLLCGNNYCMSLIKTTNMVKRYNGAVQCAIFYANAGNAVYEKTVERLAIRSR